MTPIAGQESQAVCIRAVSDLLLTSLGQDFIRHLRMPPESRDRDDNLKAIQRPVLGDEISNNLGRPDLGFASPIAWLAVQQRSSHCLPCRSNQSESN